MGLIESKPYKKLNKLTGLWEWVRPEPVEYVKKDTFRPVTIKTPKKKRR